MKLMAKWRTRELTLRRHSMRLSRLLPLCAALPLAFAPSLHGQAVLTVTPGAGATTLAGTGTTGYSGNGGAATSAAFASPRAVAYDSAGNLYIADTNNNVIREVSIAGVVTTVAGNGLEGYGGDGGAAVNAELDTPTGVAVDAAGNLYLADSHNNRIREVHNGVITTIAGTGTAGYGGDGGTATSAQLDLPLAVAVDAAGNLYIADTNNQRIRKVINGVITTIAGNGEQGYAGDGGAATSAEIDTPSGIAVDASGNLYIADSHNQRVREIGNGIISTLAGSGAVTFSGSYSGDGGSAALASLARPTGVAVDAAGNIYIADTNNHRLRKVGNGSIITIAGNGEQGYGGDGGPATSAVLNTPGSAAVNSTGDIAVADMLNQRVRGVNLPILTYAAQSVGVASAPQYITIANSGSGTLTVQSMNVSGSFATVSGGTCPALPISLTAGGSCTQAIVFQPAATGNAQGSVVVGGSAVVPQTVLLSGSSTQSAAVPQLSSSQNPSVYGSPVTLAATVGVGSTPAPTGSITFYDGGTALQTVTTSGGAASYTTSTLAVGSHSITAAYSGDSAWAAETSTALAQVVNQATPSIALVASASAVLVDNPVTLIATVNSGNAMPGGTVIFLDGTTNIGSAPLNAGQASITISTLAAGTHSITAIYSGNADFTSVTSSAVSEQVEDFTLNFNGAASATITPGGTATYHLVVSPEGTSTFPASINFSASGLPSGGVATFTPSNIASGAGATAVTLTIQTPNTAATLNPLDQRTPPVYFGIFLLPFIGLRRKQGTASKPDRREARFRRMLLFILLSAAMLAGIAGCGSQSGYFGQQQKTYTVTITGTSGALSHFTNVQIIIE